jgi:hypothetical protein
VPPPGWYPWTVRETSKRALIPKAHPVVHGMAKRATGLVELGALAAALSRRWTCPDKAGETGVKSQATNPTCRCPVNLKRGAFAQIGKH